MKAKGWKSKVKKACEATGTYKPEFEHVINDLADILEERDRTKEMYESSGATPIIKYTNKGGATNYVKNPLLLVWDDLNKSALAYWRELGLTPQGLKRLKDSTFNSAGPKEANDLLAKLARKREEQNNGRL